MKKHEVLKSLDRISEMSDEEISINSEWIKKVALASYGLIKQNATSKK